MRQRQTQQNLPYLYVKSTGQLELPSRAPSASTDFYTKTDVHAACYHTLHLYENFTPPKSRNPLRTFSIWNILCRSCVYLQRDPSPEYAP